MSNEDAAAITRRGLMLVLSSPSGAGKTTLSRQLLDNDKQIQLSVSATTRARRSGETDGVDYHFVDTATFSGMIERGEFLEHARVFDHFYGTPSAPVEAALIAGRDVLFDIDWQGDPAAQGKGRQRPGDGFHPAAVDARPRAPPDHPCPGFRWKSCRSGWAKAADEMSHWAEYDYQIINRDIATSPDGA